MKKQIVLLLLLWIGSYSFAQTWVGCDTMPVKLAFPVVVSLNGNIHVMGGGGPGGATDLHIRYTPGTDSWDTLAPVPYLAQQPAGAVVNGKIHYCGGGYPNSGTRLSKHYYYNPDSNVWHQAADMPVATAIHKAVELNGKLVCMTGQPSKTMCQYFNPDSNIWVTMNALPDANFWYGAIVNTGNSIYRFGGGGFTAPVVKAHKYNPATDTWTALPDLPQARHGLSGTALNDSLIALVGGYQGALSKKTVWIYNMNSQTYSASDSLPVAREYHESVIAGSCLYVVGGNNSLDTTVGTSLIKNCSLSISPITNPVKANATQDNYLIQHIGGNFSILFNAEVTNDAGAVNVYDMSGKLIFTDRIQKGEEQVTLNKEMFSAGMYLILVERGDQHIRAKWSRP